MDFGKKQLERMGWIEGKGLGLNEDGIIKAVKPNVQLNSRGLGFSVADSIQIKNQWWSEAYNSASKGLKHDYRITSVGVVIKPQKFDSNSPDSSSDKYGSRFTSAGYLERYEDKIVAEQEDERKRKKKEKKNKKLKKEKISDPQNEEDDEISTTKIEVLGVEIIDDSSEVEDPFSFDSENKQNKKKKNKRKYQEVEGEKEEAHEMKDNKQVEKQNKKRYQEDKLKSEKNTDKKIKKVNHIDFNEIFQMSEGMTCHKAARHGINMTGKMKRLQEQEAEFLKKFKGVA